MLTRIRSQASALLTALLTVLLLALCVNAPARADQPNVQALQGAWMGSQGSDTMLLMFMGNICGLSLNDRQMYGNWTLSGNRLDMRFQNGKSLSYSVDLQGDSLVLDGSVRLTRQAMPGAPGQPGPAAGAAPGAQPGGQPSGQPANPWGQPQPGAQPGTQPGGGTWGQPQTGGQPGGQPGGGTWGQPQPGAQPGGQPGGWGQPQTGGQPGGWGAPQQQPQAGLTPLEGSWSFQSPQGRLTFRFSGNRYAQLINGQLNEEGEFNYLPDGRLQYRILRGQGAGQTGENRVMVNGNALTFTWANGMSLVFMRDGM